MEILAIYIKKEYNLNNNNKLKNIIFYYKYFHRKLVSLKCNLSAALQ